ncbi:MAG TPA: HAMP domain-containing protein [Bdellovibrionales bacterium]|nr:HAMP domain-containing protein [Bdellovibrionales bacterium]
MEIETSTPKPPYVNRQTILGLIVRPRQQVRIALVFIAGTWVVLLGLIAVLWAGDEPSSGFTIRLMVCAGTLLSLYAVLAGFYLNHRVFGPIVSLKRFMASLREGDYTARLQLRSTDDLGELRDSLNDLAEALEKRHGPGKRPS